MEKSKQIERRQIETREKARNLVEDIQMFREFVEGETPSRAVLRLVSTALRRMFLQQEELKKVAEVRIVDFRIDAPDFSAFVTEPDTRAVFFAGGGGTVFGVTMQAAVIQEGGGTMPANFDPSTTVPHSIKDFLKAKTLLWRGVWFSRKEIIEFVAHKMGGAHTGKLSNKKERILKDLSAHGSLSLQNNIATASMPFPSEELKAGNLKLSSSEIDFLLFETFSAMDMLINSSKTTELVERVLGELSDE